VTTRQPTDSGFDDDSNRCELCHEPISNAGECSCGDGRERKARALDLIFDELKHQPD
jgi:hypothetical protein